MSEGIGYKYSDRQGTVRMAISWKETEGTVASVEQNSNGALRNALTVVFTYKVDGHWYGGTFVSNFDRYVEGQTLTVRYDTSDPATNDLTKKDTRRLWLTCALFAGAGLVILLLRLAGFR
jgi:hypothetical protein